MFLPVIANADQQGPLDNTTLSFTTGGVMLRPSIRLERFARNGSNRPGSAPKRTSPVIVAATHAKPRAAAVERQQGQQNNIHLASRNLHLWLHQRFWNAQAIGDHRLSDAPAAKAQDTAKLQTGEKVAEILPCAEQGMQRWLAIAGPVASDLRGRTQLGQTLKMLRQCFARTQLSDSIQCASALSHLAPQHHALIHEVSSAVSLRTKRP